jgi:hypothetical protein
MPRFAPYGFVRGHLNIYIPLPAGTGAVEVVTDLVPGFAFTIEKVTAIVQIAGTGANASRVFRVLKGASTVVATATLLLADTTPVGALKAFTVTAAAADYTDADTLTVDFPTAGAVAFTAGSVELAIQYRQRAQRAA